MSKIITGSGDIIDLTTHSVKTVSYPHAEIHSGN